MREDCAAGWGKGGLLGGRGLCCSAGERWTARRGRAVLLGGLLCGRGLCCKAGERWTARWQKAVLLGDRGDDEIFWLAFFFEFLVLVTRQ